MSCESGRNLGTFGTRKLVHMGLFSYFRLLDFLFFGEPSSAAAAFVTGISLSTAREIASTTKSLRVIPWMAAQALALLTNSSGRSRRLIVFVSMISMYHMIQMMSTDKYVCRQWLGRPTMTFVRESAQPTVEVDVSINNDLSGVLEKAPRDCWLALNEEQTSIVGRGETMEEAVKEATAHGVQDPILILAPKTWRPAIY
jgi:hypothetical protein